MKFYAYTLGYIYYIYFFSINFQLIDWMQFKITQNIGNDNL